MITLIFEMKRFFTKKSEVKKMVNPNSGSTGKMLNRILFKAELVMFSFLFMGDYSLDKIV